MILERPLLAGWTEPRTSPGATSDPIALEHVVAVELDARCSGSSAGARHEIEGVAAADDPTSRWRREMGRAHQRRGLAALLGVRLDDDRPAAVADLDLLQARAGTPPVLAPLGADRFA